MLKKISVPSAGRVPPQLWESCVNTLLEGPSDQSSTGSQSLHWAQGGSRRGPIPRSREQADVKGHRRHTLVPGGGPDDPGSSSSGLARALLSLCFRCFLLLLVSLLLRRIAVNIKYTHMHSRIQRQGLALLLYYLPVPGLLTNPLDGEHLQTQSQGFILLPYSPSRWISHYLSLQPRPLCG